MQYFDMSYHFPRLFSKIFFSTVLVECKPYCLTQTSFKQLLSRYLSSRLPRIHIVGEALRRDEGVDGLVAYYVIELQKI